MLIPTFTIFEDALSYSTNTKPTDHINLSDNFLEKNLVANFSRVYDASITDRDYYSKDDKEFNSGGPPIFYTRKSDDSLSDEFKLMKDWYREDSTLEPNK